MGGAGIQMKIALDSKEVSDRLHRAVMRSLNHKPLLEAFGKMLITSTHHRFETQTGPDGRPWQALAPATVKARQERNTTRSKRGIASSAMAALSGKSGSEPLFVTARLMQSATYKAGEMFLALGTNVKFPGGGKSAAAIHQLGGDAGRGHKVHIPARPFFGISAEDERGIIGLTGDAWFASV